MKYINRIFEKATVRGIADYLLFGIEPDEDNRTVNHANKTLLEGDKKYQKVNEETRRKLKI